jgi:hypothetical protein
MGHFEWPVAKGGYHCDERLWQDIGEAHPGATKVRVLTPGHTLAWRHSRPLVDTPVLYRTFADVEPTEAGIQRFANHYGLLGLWGVVVLDEGLPVQAEPFAKWQEYIRDMRHALMVWDVLRWQDQETLHRWVTREQGGLEQDGKVLYYRIAPDAPLSGGRPFLKEPRRSDGMLSLALRDPQSYVVEPLPPSDVEGYALAWLQVQINWHLAEYVNPYVGYDPESDSAVPLTMQPMPKHLYGALWLQFALSVGGKEWDQQCRECNTWFRVPAKARRPNTAYCSTRCRVKAARQRQTDSAVAVSRSASP